MHLNTRKILLLTGAMLNAFPLSLLVYFGNVLPYIASYFHAHRDEMVLFLDPLWISSAFVCAYSISMVVTSPIELRFGLRPCFIVHNIILCITVMSGYFTVREPLALTLIFGGIQGVSDGALYTLSLKLLLQEMRGQEGLATGVMTSGYVFGALLNIGLAFLVINPSNKEADLQVDKKMFFSDNDLLDRVPFYFLISGAMTVASTILGSCLLFLASSKPDDTSQLETQFCRSMKKEQDGNHNFAKLITGDGKEVPLLKATFPQEYNSLLIVAQDKLKDCEDTFLLSDNKEMVSQKNVISNQIEKPVNTQNTVRCAEFQPHQLIKSGRFWCLWISFMTSNHTRYLQLNMYKQYGQLAITNDSMLVITGLISTAAMVFIQPLVGIISDKFGIRNTAVAFNISSCVFMCLMVLVLRASPLSYMIFVVLENLTVSPQILLFSILTSLEFGRIHFASNMGLVCSGNLIIILFEPFLINAMVSVLGWDWLFISGSASAIVATLCIMAMNWFECD